MNKNLTFRNISNKNTKAFRGGTAQEQEQFELNLQLHAGVSNPYTFKITKNYKASADTKAAIPPYTEKSWTTPGTYTWTVPAGVTKVRVAVCGGGGGGANIDSDSRKAAGSGETSSVKRGSSVIIQATGGGGGIARYNYYDGNKGSGGNAGTPNGHAGISTSGKAIPDTIGFALSFTKGDGAYGSGGGCSQQYISISSGGSGGYDSNYVSVVNGETLTVTVGSGGAKYDYNGRGVPRDGTSGFVLIAYGEGIE